MTDARAVLEGPLPQHLLPRNGRLDEGRIRQLASPLDRFYRYWLALPQEYGGVPSRRAFRPEAIRDLLPQVLLIDVEGEEAAARYRYRLIGTAHRPHMRAEFTGLYVDEVQPAERYARASASFAEIVGARQPGWWRNYALMAEDSRSPYHLYERVLAPFCDADGRVTLLAGVWHWIRDARPLEWTDVQI
jgi:hypothetical protein